MDTAVALAACHFSMGATFKTLLCKTIGLVPGDNLKRKAAARTALRLEKAERAGSVLAKRRRKELKFKTKLKANKQKSLEGDTYAAGAFDFYVMTNSQKVKHNQKIIEFACRLHLSRVWSSKI